MMAVPYAVLENYKSESALNPKNFYAPNLLENSYYFTKTFYIKYCEEIVDIGEICRFKAEIDVFPSINEKTLFLECDLMFFDTINSQIKFDLVFFFFFFKKKPKFLAKENSDDGLV
jgi:hypothetical protein